MKKKTLPVLIILLAITAMLTIPGAAESAAAAYEEPENWAFYAEGSGDADLFFICPTVDLGADGRTNMSLDDEEIKASFVGASRMELGIYDDCVVYAPYYRQVTLAVYSLPEEEAEPCFALAYADVKAAFEYYLANSSPDRPLILAGFSQGADMAIRLLKEFGEDDALMDRLAACYAIGWRLTEEEVSRFPWLVPAAGEDDTGCIIAFNSEAEGITDSLLVPAGVRTYAINPLNWKTDSSPAAASLNLGACFTDYDGQILREIPGLTGAWLDPDRGTLICPDIDPDQYPGVLFADGIYHLYDYQFFYRNLQQNVSVRLAAWNDKGEGSF